MRYEDERAVLAFFEQLRPAPVVESAPAPRQAEVRNGDPATSSTERALAAAFGQVLGIQEIGTNDNFFELGGDSLMAAQIIALTKTALGTEISVAMIFRAPTVAQLAQRIDEQGHRSR